jgi:hypothetical protein
MFSYTPKAAHLTASGRLASCRDRAASAVIQERTRGDNLTDREDDVGALSSKFQGDLFEVRLGSGDGDAAAGSGRSGEGDLAVDAAGGRSESEKIGKVSLRHSTSTISGAHLVNVHMPRESVASDRSETVYDVPSSFGKANRVEHFGEEESGQRGVLRRLKDDGATGGKSGGDLPDHHEGRVVLRGRKKGHFWDVERLRRTGRTQGTISAAVGEEKVVSVSL